MTPIDEFEAIQNQMNEFSQKFESALTRKRAQIINDKQQHYVKVNDLKNQEAQLQSDIENFRSKETKIKDTIKKTMEDLQLQQLKIDELKRKQHALNQEKANVQGEIDELNHKIQSKSESISQSQRSLSEQARRDSPELLKYEQYLGLRIQVLGQDSLKFTFGNIDPNDYAKEVWCSLLVGGILYKLDETFPPLSHDEKAEIIDELNEKKDFVSFLKSIRLKLISASL